MNKNSLLFVFAAIFSFAGINAEFCPEIDLTRAYSNSELSVLDNVTAIGPIHFSKSIPKRDRITLNYSTMSWNQKSILNRITSGNPQELVNLVNGNTDLDFLALGTSLYGLCTENCTTNCEPLLKEVSAGTMSI